MSTGHFQKLPQNCKFMLGTIPEMDEEALTIEAQFNPKELQIESPIGWKEHASIGAQSVATKPMEFTGMGVETMKVELVFDAFEEDNDAVVNSINTLKQMAQVREPNEPKAKGVKQVKGVKQRPNFCVATWGTQQPFRCVIESISVKYTMFSTDGTPVRATVMLGLKSGRRTIDTAAETTFETKSNERLEAQRQRMHDERKIRSEQTDRERAQRLREHRQAEEARYQASASDRRLAEREARVEQEQRELQATRAQRQQAIDQRHERIERERRIADAERQVAADREDERKLREQRKKDFDLE